MKIRYVTLIVFLVAMCSCCSNELITPSFSQDFHESQTEDSLENHSSNPIDYGKENTDLIYEALLGDFYSLYQTAHQEKDTSLRYIKFAKAEASLLDSGILLPFSSENVSYTLSRLVPYTTPNITLYNNQYNFKNLLVTKDFLTIEEEEILHDLWLESIKKETIFDSSNFLKQQNHELVNQLSLVYDTNFTTLNPYIYSSKGNQIALKQCFDTLFEYDNQGNLIPCIADQYHLSEDGLTYTITIKDNLYYYTHNGEIYSKIKAVDFVDGIKYYLDNGENIPFLYNAEQYVKGNIPFELVGIKVKDETTFEFTLTEAIPEFLAYFTSSYFYPFNNQFYQEHKDNFGDILDPSTMLYTGAFYPVSTSEKQIILNKNLNYSSQEKIALKSIIFSVDYLQDKLTLQNTLDNVYSEIQFEEGSIIHQIIQQSSEFDEILRITPMSDTTNFALLNVNRNCFETNSIKTGKSEKEIENTWYAMQNKNFRKAICHSIDRSHYNSFIQGSNLSTYNLRNSLTSYEFVRLPQEITFEGKTFLKNTFYGEILEYYYNQLGNELSLKEHIDSFYNPQLAKRYLSLAKEELNEHFQDTITLDVLCLSQANYQNQANALKESIENSLDHQVKINLLVCKNQFSYFDAYNSGCYDILLNTFWTPDYQDPSAYLRIFTPEGDKIKLIGL